MTCVLICFNQLNYLMTTWMKEKKIYKSQQQQKQQQKCFLCYFIFILYFVLFWVWNKKCIRFPFSWVSPVEPSRLLLFQVWCFQNQIKNYFNKCLQVQAERNYKNKQTNICHFFSHLINKTNNFFCWEIAV